MSRALSPVPVTSLQEYLRDGGGRGLAAAREIQPEAVIAEVECRDRGIGPAGPGRCWGSVWAQVEDGAAYGVGAAAAPSVVINAAEGEPGSFKDRAILLRNLYRVFECALIAARAVGAT